MTMRISLLVLLNGNAPALSVTLAALAPAAIDGLIADAHVFGHPGLAECDLAEEAGARRLAPGELDGLAPSARGAWLLAANAGWSPPDGWDAAAASHLARSLQREARIRGARAARRPGWPWPLFVPPQVALLAPMSAFAPRLGSGADVEAVRAAVARAARGAARLKPGSPRA